MISFPFLIMAQQVTTLSPNSNIDDALLLDAEGRLYGSHYQGSAVFRLTPGEWTPEVFSDGYSTPNGLAFDKEGVLYMADNRGNRIYTITPDGTKTLFLDFFNPSGLIFEQDSDSLIVTSYEGNRIVKIAPDKGLRTWTEGGLLNGPVGLCYDDDGRLYTGNFNDRQIIRIEEDGSQVPIARASGTGWLGFIAYARGYIYGTLFSQHKIYRTDLVGNDTILLGSTAGTVDGDATMARFNTPNGILASPTQDTLYISDYGTRSLRMITNLDPLVSTLEPIESPALNWSLYPNPTTTELNVEMELKQPRQVQIQIIDVKGQAMDHSFLQDQMAAGLQRIPLSVDQLPKGMYYVRILLDDRMVMSRSFVIP